MNAFRKLAQRIRRNEPLPAPLRALLWAASFGQRFGMWLRLQRRPVKVAAYVVSYGNLTAGGVGKTPAVIERAAREAAAGKRVAILTRGYGGAPVREPIALAPGQADAQTVARFGDEAALIARRVPGVWIVRAANRVAGAHVAIEQGCNLMIMDDGFQAVALARDENILLIDATNPFGNNCLVPRGILREAPAAMKRATEIILTRCDQASENLAAIEKVINRYAPDIPIRRTQHRPVGLWRVRDGSEAPLALLRNAAVRVVCGIGNPDAFVALLRELGARITEIHNLPDHAAIPETLLEGSALTIMTEKDAMRIHNATSPGAYALAICLDRYES